MALSMTSPESPSSDYGSDFDTDGEETVQALLGSLEVNPIDSLALEPLVEDDNKSICIAHVPKSSQESGTTAYFSAPEEQVEGRASITVRVNNGTDTEAETVATLKDNGPIEKEREVSVHPEASSTDTRSPLQRFRTAPKKPLSVTDIVSPAWCELQYWYTLTKHGKKLRTPAMRQGSAVHRALEEQVHTIVPITVQTKEDAWGLRMWNVIQDLRTLRATGMTRELEVWGVIDGQVINGVIDEVSYTCPDYQLEAELIAKKDGTKKAPPPSQQTIDEYFGTRRPNGTNHNFYQKPPSEKRKIYLTDVKTRSRPSLPAGAAMRPTLMQLMLYRSLFTSLAANSVPADTIFDRYSLNASIPFSDAFIAEISNLDFNFSDSAGLGSDDGVAALSSQSDAINELHQHNNLTLLWQLMIQEFAHTVPSSDCVGDVLRAEFILARDQSVLGSKCFAYDEEVLNGYVREEMKWWRGEREAKGVDVEEAYKCRMCDFAEDCTWRKEKIEEAIGKHREKKGRASIG